MRVLDQSVKIKYKIKNNFYRNSPLKGALVEFTLRCMFFESNNFFNKNLFLTGLKDIQDCLKESLKRKLKKSLSHDWIPESRAHAFPLRGYYVQLNWRRKIRTAMETENVTMASLHELIMEKIKTTDSDAKKNGQSFIMEGNSAAFLPISLMYG